MREVLAADPRVGVHDLAVEQTIVNMAVAARPGWARMYASDVLFHTGLAWSIDRNAHVLAILRHLAAAHAEPGTQVLVESTDDPEVFLAGVTSNYQPCYSTHPAFAPSGSASDPADLAPR